MKTQEKHTPGPWQTAPSSNPKNGTGWRDIVSTGGPFSPSYVGEALECDARLIAAAPELLAALRYLMREAVAGGILTCEPGIQRAEAAIAKATGE